MPEAQAVRHKWDSRSFYLDAIKGLLAEYDGVFPDLIERRTYFSAKALVRAMGYAETHQNVQGPGGLCAAGCGTRVGLSRHSSLCHFATNDQRFRPKTSARTAASSCTQGAATPCTTWS